MKILRHAATVKYLKCIGNFGRKNRPQKCTRSGVLESMALHFLLARGESHILLKILLCLLKLMEEQVPQAVKDSVIPPYVQARITLSFTACGTCSSISLRRCRRPPHFFPPKARKKNAKPEHPQLSRPIEFDCIPHSGWSGALMNIAFSVVMEPQCRGWQPSHSRTAALSHRPAHFYASSKLETTFWNAWFLELFQRKQTPQTCRSIRAKPLWLAQLPLAPFAPSNLRHE